MSKQLPYFKFHPAEWIKGDITLCSIESQGLFINLCCFYWLKDCSICLANAKQRFSKHEASINELLKHEIILLDEDENIVINFLDEQMKEFIDISEKRSKSGQLGGKSKCKANAKQMQSKCKAIREEKRREREDNIYRFSPPELSEVKLYFIENGYREEIAEKAYNYYSVAGWKDSKGNKIKNWKQKMQGVWFKEENKKQRPKLAI